MYSLAELKRQREAEDPQAHAEARAQRRERTEVMKKAIQAKETQRVKEQEAQRAQEARQHAAQEEHRAREALRFLQQEAQRVQRARDQDLEDANELAEIQEYEALKRELAQNEVRAMTPAVPAATLLQSAVESARQALLYADQLRRNIFLQEREQKLVRNVLNYEIRVRAEWERKDRGVTVPPIEYIIGELRRRNGDFSPGQVTLRRVLLGECNITFSYISAPCGGNQGITGEVWQRQNPGFVPWVHFNRVKGDTMPEVDPDFQDDMFILPYFREKIATHLEHHSMIHSANYTKPWYIGHAGNKTDATFEVMLTFLALMKELNRIDYAQNFC